MLVISGISISSGVSALDVMRFISSGSAQFALVVDEYHRLLGTLTDGDIRRGLLLATCAGAFFMGKHLRHRLSG